MNRLILWITKKVSVSMNTQYQQLRSLCDPHFKRLCGVSHATFREMVSVVGAHLERQGKRGGQNRLSPEDQVLIALDYWREYRTYFHIGHSWGVHESTVCRIVHKVETLLLESGRWRLPGKKQLVGTPVEWEAVIVDVTEVPIERPKKSSISTTAAKSTSTPSRGK
jgi:hypothetical protein